jgi:Tfp pilus assembly protein PilO
MNTKNIFAVLILVIVGLLVYSFILPFKEVAVDNVSEELVKLQTAFEQASQQLSLKTLRMKRQQLSEQDSALLTNFIPQNLHSGQFVYNIGQIANLNRMNLKGLQYAVIDDTLNNPTGEKKLMVEFTMEGRYEDFANWVRTLENSNVLIDVESIRGAKTANSGETITFYAKLFAYGINID